MHLCMEESGREKSKERRKKGQNGRTVGPQGQVRNACPDPMFRLSLKCTCVSVRVIVWIVVTVCYISMARQPKSCSIYGFPFPGLQESTFLCVNTV